MTNKQFIKNTSDNLGIPQSTIKKVLDAVEIELKNELKQDGAVIKLCDITFSHYTLQPRRSRNPKTGEEIITGITHKLKAKYSQDWERLIGNK